MFRARILLPLAAFGILAALLAQGQTIPAIAPKPPVPAAGRTAVVNLHQIYDQLDESRDADRQLTKLRDDFSKQLETRKADIDRLSSEVIKPTLYKPGSAEALQLQDELLQKTLDLKSFTEFCQQKLFIQLRTTTLQIHQHIDQAIAAYAQANGIDLVLVADEFALAAARAPQELETFPNMRKVVYFPPACDISRAITLKMNTEYGVRKP